MKVERERVGNVEIVELAGVIKLGESARAVSELLEELLASGVPAVLLDLERVNAVDSTGLGELVGYLQRFGEQGRRLALLDPPERIMSLLRLTRLDEVFPIYRDRETALAELGA